MRGRAIYRLPFAKECVTVAGEVHRLDPSMVLNKINGFLIEPFIATKEESALYIESEVVTKYDSSNIPSIEGFDIPVSADFIDRSLTREEYNSHFEYYKKCITDGLLKKGVFVRRMNHETEESHAPLTLFRKACEMYPRMMVALFSTPISGTWIVCTPELLLERISENVYHTTAIAGSKPLSELGEDWSPRVLKDINDVKNHILKTLEHFSHKIKVSGPETVRAGDLLHLRTDIIFEIIFPRVEGVLVRTLHPSPCVCGIPRDASYELIIELNTANKQKRHFFGGSMGPVNIDDKTNIYVILHSMQLHSMHRQTIYEGISIYENSDADEKWIETKEKLDSMLKLINACK